MEKMNEVDYDKDVIEAANLAIAIQKEDFTTNIELSLACENLPRMDTFSQTDPMIVVLIDKENTWVELGKTEVIPETIFPKFMKTFVVSYNFEKQQKLRFEVYDIDSFQDKNDLDKQDYIGFVETDLHEIVCSPTQSIYKPILNPHNKRRKNGTLIVKGCEFDINSSKYVFKFSARNIVSKAELFLRVFTLNENQEFIPVTSTDTIRGSKKGTYEWSPIMLVSAKILSEGDPIRLELCEFNKNKGNIVLGECEIAIDKILRKDNTMTNITKNNAVLGQIQVEANKIVRHTFLNYIYAGTQVSLIVGIDFSKSNKDPYDVDSLHRVNDLEDNDYVHALKSIVGILQYYDHDNKFPAYGFGAKLPPSHRAVSQCFALNGNFFNPEVFGIEDILRVYRETISSVKFHGPQIFSEILKMTRMYASAEKITNSNQKYYILLMLTNGLISDFEFTRNAIKEISHLPLSIIIVGIGEGIGKNKEGEEIDYFSLLQRLKDIPGVTRNIVQFVKFNEVKDDVEKIAKEVLASVPKQFLDFMDVNKIEPMINDISVKNTSRDYKQMKIEDFKLKKGSKLHDNIPLFLLDLNEQISKKLKNEFHYDPGLVDFLLNERGIPANDFNLIYDILSEEKNRLKSHKSQNKSLQNNFDESQENRLKKQCFIPGPHVKHRFFRSRDGRSCNFYEKIKKKSENLDETKRILDKNYKRIYDSPVYERKRNKTRDSSSENSSLSDKSMDCGPQNQGRLLKTPRKASRQQSKSPLKTPSKNPLPLENLTLNKPDIISQLKSPESFDNSLVSALQKKTRKQKPKSKVLGKNKLGPSLQTEDIFYDPLRQSLDSNRCVACQKAKIEILNLPCGHACCCESCFFKGTENCLFCNSVVRNYVTLSFEVRPEPTDTIEA